MKQQKFKGMENFEVVSLGETLHGRHLSVSPHAPTVLIATGGGDNGSLGQSWQQFPYLLEQASISSIIFDFAGQGLSAGKRRELSVTKALQNLTSVLHHISQWDSIEPDNLALLGASLGGNVILEYLAQDNHLPVQGATLKSPCILLRESYICEIGEKAVAQWQQTGFSAEAGLNWSVIQDSQDLAISKRLDKIHTPLLITHGTNDTIVPITQSYTIKERVSGPVDFVEMKGVNHHYSSGSDWDRMAAIHIAWLKVLFDL